MSFLKATVEPIPKSFRLDCNVSANYRAIALSCIFGKVLDKTEHANVIQLKLMMQ